MDIDLDDVNAYIETVIALGKRIASALELLVIESDKDRPHTFCIECEGLLWPEKKYADTFHGLLYCPQCEAHTFFCSECGCSHSVSDDNARKYEKSKETRCNSCLKKERESHGSGN